MKLDKYIIEPSDRKRKKFKTLNIDEDLHLFFKRTASYYNIPLSDLMYNVLSSWKEKYQDKIENDMKSLDG
ncbi:MAG: hypothetical protein RIC06_25695 [Cyclobacteriaceae bacterium]